MQPDLLREELLDFDTGAIKLPKVNLNPMNLHRLNIGIIGGGIGGVAAAVALHRAGIHATVYERANELREVGAGMMLWPNATRVLKELDVLERVVASSGPNQHFLVPLQHGLDPDGYRTGSFPTYSPRARAAPIC